MALKMGMAVHKWYFFFKFLVVRLDDSMMNGVCNQTTYFIISSIVIIKSFFFKS